MIQGEFKVLGNFLKDKLKKSIVGWVKDSTNRQENLRVEIQLNGKLLQTIVANQYSKMLQSEGSKDCCCGFSLVLDDVTLYPIFSEIRVKIVDSNYYLPNKSLAPYLNPVFFIHLPKTGGTSLREMFESRVVSHAILPDEHMIRRFNGMYPDGKYLAAIHQKERNRFSLLRGHYHYSFFNLLPAPCSLVTVLREPVERTISHALMYLRTHPHLKDYTVDRFIKEHISLLNNFQTRFFCRQVYSRFDVEIDPNLYCQRFVPTEMPLSHHDYLDASEKLSSVQYVGVQDRLDEFVEMLFNGSQKASLKRLNVSKDNQSIGGETLEIIEKNTELDRKLYCDAQRLFEGQYLNWEEYRKI